MNENFQFIAPGDQRDEPGVRVKVYIRDDMIGVGKIDLMRLIDSEGTIDAAAAKMGVDRERAWFLIETLQRCFEEPLLNVTRGEETAPATLTNLGREVIARHDAHREAVAAASEDYLRWLKSKQRSGKRNLR